MITATARMTTFTCLAPSCGLFLLVSALLGCSSSGGGTEGLKLVSVKVPSHPLTGKPVELFCNFDLEGDKLYSVKWYRGMNEFYSYVPGDSIPSKTFQQPGITVYRAMSDQRKVTLRSVSLQSSGLYKCEVSADSPFFHTVSDSDEMLVVDMPDENPSITGGQAKYHVGDHVNVNCTSERSRPAASLEWYINNEKVKAESDKLVQYTPVNDSDGLETSRLGLHFTARPQHFPAGQLRLKCTATIAAVYHMFTEENVEGQLPQTGPALESKGVYTGGSISSSNLPHTWVSCLLTLLVHTLHLLIQL